MKGGRTLEEAERMQRGAVRGALVDAAWRGVVDLRAIVAKVAP